MAAASRDVRVHAGAAGAVAAAHPLAVGAACGVLDSGGSAVDAAVAAQAMLAVVMPDACGLGGDGLFLVHNDGVTTAVNGAGPAAAASGVRFGSDGGSSVTVPGLVGAWSEVHRRWGRLPLARDLAPATRVAHEGHPVGPTLAFACREQRPRLLRGGAGGWSLLSLDVGQQWLQPELAALLTAISTQGSDAFYRGAVATAIERAVTQNGGDLAAADLAAHVTVVAPPVEVEWAGGVVAVQPPTSQGVLLAMSLQWLERHGAPAERDHIMVELTEAAFGFRARSGAGTSLLAEPLTVDPVRATRRGGPRSYLHTAGVAAADAGGMVVSSLVSVFDDFGSATYVPEGGFTLNNRAAGFTEPPNEPAPGKRPVHTLAPVLVQSAKGDLWGLATPGADGQVQTLLQILAAMRYDGRHPSTAIAAPRWRSEAGRLLIEESHPAVATLAAAGHDVVPLVDGDSRFGGAVAAGFASGSPLTCGDWRREIWSGVA